VKAVSSHGGIALVGAPTRADSTSTPVSVTSSMCSNWALRLPSRVVTVHSSGHMMSPLPPSLIMGSMVNTCLSTHARKVEDGGGGLLGGARRQALCAPDQHPHTPTPRAWPHPAFMMPTALFFA
jgi:hypothetical protein